MYKPEPVLKKENHKILWDSEIKTVTQSRPEDQIKL